MSSTDFRGALVKAEGIVRRVDRVAREVEVEIDGRLVVFDVLPDCAILLNGQMVRLRLLLPRDRVKVDYSQGPDLPVTHSIRVLGSPRGQAEVTSESPDAQPGQPREGVRREDRTE